MRSVRGGFIKLAMGAAAIVVVGCSSSDAAEEKPATPPTVALVVNNFADPFYAKMDKGASAKALLEAANYIPAGQLDKGVDPQIARINELIAANPKPDVLLITPADATKMVEPLSAANAAGIHVITLDTFIGANTYGQGGPADFPLAHIGSDNYEGGRIACAELVTRIGGMGKIFIESGFQGRSSTDGRVSGCKDVLATSMGVTLVGVNYSNNDNAIGQMHVNDAVTANPDLGGIFCANVAACQAVSDAVTTLKAASMAASLHLVAFDAPPATVAGIRAGTFDACVAQKPGLMGDLGVDYSVKLHSGISGLPTRVSTGFVTIKKENVDSPEITQYFY